MSDKHCTHDLHVVKVETQVPGYNHGTFEHCNRESAMQFSMKLVTASMDASDRAKEYLKLSIYRGRPGVFSKPILKFLNGEPYGYGYDI